MQKNKMYDILESPDKHVHKTYGGNGVLSRLWRQMLLNLQIGPHQFGKMLESHVTNPINGVPNNRKDQISYRGNLTKEFAKPQMTWKVFMKALRFLNILNIELILVAKHRNMKFTVHKTFINFDSRTDAQDFDMLLEQSELNEAVQSIPYLDSVSDVDLFQDANSGLEKDGK